jgi:beta-lactamase regulating signal transducer with metallopeptidase domain
MAEATLVIKVTVIFTIALVAAGAAGRARASVRSLILAAAFGAALALPLVSAVGPEHEVSIPEAYAPAFLVEQEPATAAVTATAAATLPAADVASRHLPLFLWLTRGLWLLGFVVTVAPLLLGLWRVRQARGRSRLWVAGQQVAAALPPASSQRGVAVLLHDDVVTPMTCGWIRPTIVMPADAPQWSAADVRQALVHELEHVRRRDWPIHVLARFTCALYWFHPAAWLAWRQLTLECERACDDAVVAQAESTAYAEQLVALARRFTKRSAAPMLSMADRRTLSTRVAWILNADVARGRAGLTATALVLTAAVAAAAAIAPVQAVPAAAPLRFDVARGAAALRRCIRPPQ